MYPKPPIGQMHPNQGHHSYTPYPIPQLPPMAQKKKGFLSKLFKKHDPTEPFMQMVPPYRQMEGPPMMHQQPPPQYQQQYQQQYSQQYQPYMQQHPQQMIPPQMYESNETRGAATTTAAATSSSGIGSFFSNLISNPTNMINNIEKVSQVVQSVGPVVEQYGPIMRSLPSIVKILTSGKGTEEKQAEDQPGEVEVVTPPPPPKKRKRKKIVIEPIIEKELPEEPIQQIATKPKLYV
ncbi:MULTISPECIES: VrrA/YqfQ family protein [Bacillus]|uniref:VrrA/YqfQ family protein n=1 Tax=Bacillus TaxID=1386 RepID=UPI0004690C1F|nr:MULTISPECIES: VrrA/YqfQ family protein [Bacillus]MED1409603.1 VrrA/YqfQ family protein [Bacillus paramycoides]MED1464639.1 VrrA/YqfQ family protein [Bacillus paramycoides]MED1491600.1 VrrA/YqfQ family protein [Bacillus paramycoides]